VVLPRSEEDEALFRQCLPQMGMLYSMFPVLVCEEVTGTVVPYTESGWCFSELHVALLGGQLDKYSSQCGVVQKLAKPPHSSEGDELQHFVDTTNESLDGKFFQEEENRATVRGIIGRFVLKGRLVDAVRNRHAGRLAEVLSDLEHRQLRGFLDEPVDELMNTPLHLAVARGFTSGVRQLLSSGANPTLRNLRGDTPVQYFLLPRLGSAASACRAVHSSLAAGAGDPEQIGAAFIEDGGMAIVWSSGSFN